MSSEVPSVVAAVLMLARELCPDRKEWPWSVGEILVLTGSGRSQAYQVLQRLREDVGTLLRSPGRPASQPLEQSTRQRIADAVIVYLLDHPGAAYRREERRIYSDDFRRFIVGLTAPGQPGEGLSAAVLASACRLPTGTVKAWLRLGRPPEPPPGPPSGTAEEPHSSSDPVSSSHNSRPETEPAAPDASQQEAAGTADTSGEPAAPNWIRTTFLWVIITLWMSWNGPFNAFCEMLRRDQRLPFSDTYIGDFLKVAGLRERKPRTPAEAPWSRGTFQEHFPGAQWLGDGTTIAVHWKNQILLFNVSAILDVGSNAIVGFDVSDSENEEALIRAFEAGVATTGSAPLALTLDNKPCNHTPAIIAALALHPPAIAAAVGSTILLRATPGRGQAKAALEGAFGLFQQSLPALVLEGGSPREIARSALKLVLTAWFRGRNGRPRKRLKGLSPAELYATVQPTPEEIQQALDWYRKLARRQEKARLTREARRDPVRLELLRIGLEELGISDPERQIAVRLAGYSREAIARGLATFRAKQDMETIPTDAEPARYLGGIIRQLNTRMELEQTSAYLLEQRIRLNDLTMAPLRSEAEQLRSSVAACDLPQSFLDRALGVTYAVDFQFWAKASAGALSALPETQRQAYYKSLCRRAAASFKTERGRREDLIDRLAEAVATAA